MGVRVFIDTNIFVYAKLITEQDLLKHQQAKSLLQSQENVVVISTQVLSEFTSVLTKQRISDAVIQNAVNDIVEDCVVSPVSLSTIEKAWQIKMRYQFSYWDSVIVASALENQCVILITEDLQDNQNIEATLRIKNPF